MLKPWQSNTNETCEMFFHHIVVLLTLLKDRAIKNQNASDAESISKSKIKVQFKKNLNTFRAL